MALPQYAKIKEQASRRLQADEQVQNDAINRRIAQMGGANKGAFDKMRMQQQTQNVQNREDVLSGIDVAEAAEEQRQKEVADERAFVSGEAQKGRDFQGGQFDKDLGFRREALDKELGFRREGLEVQKDQFNRQLGFQWDESNFNKDQVRKAQRSRMIGGLVDPGGALGMGSIADSSGGLFDGGGSFFCGHMFSQMLINKHEFKELSLLMDSAARQRPLSLARYLKDAPGIVERSKEQNFQWDDLRKKFIDPILDAMRSDKYSLALDLYEVWLSEMRKVFPEQEVASGHLQAGA